MDKKREGIDNKDKRKTNKIDVKIASVVRLLGQGHVDKERYDQAIQLCSRNIEKGFNVGESYFHRGFIYFQKREYRNSQADINRAKAFGYRVSEEFLDNLFMYFRRENN